MFATGITVAAAAAKFGVKIPQAEVIEAGVVYYSDGTIDRDFDPIEFASDLADDDSEQFPHTNSSRVDAASDWAADGDV
jgi:hypothetical protein